MPTVRVFTHDSHYSAVRVSGSNGNFICQFDSDGGRYPELGMSTYYNAKATPLPVCNVESSMGITFRFNFNTVPELRGKRVTNVTGPYAFLRSKDTYIYCSGSSAYSVYTDPGTVPYLEFLGFKPGTSSGYDRIGLAAVNQYMLLRGNDSSEYIRNGTLAISTCIHASVYPKVLNAYYNGWVEAFFDSHMGEFRPYVEVSYEDAGIEVINCSPLSGFINEQEVNRFSWGIAVKSQDAIGGVTQSSASIKWQAAGDPSVNVIPVNSTDMFYDMPARSLPNGEIKWCVMVMGDGGQRSEYSGWFTLTTVDNVALPPTNLSPNGSFLDGSLPITFSWRHNSPLSTPPYAFEVETKPKDGAWTALSGKTVSRQSSYTVPGGRFTGGAYSFRVKDYTSDNVPSAYSEAASFTVRAGPPTPEFRSIEADSNRPLVLWISPTQVAFQLIVADIAGALYDSGTKAGNETSFRLPEFLKNGRYTFRLRVQNSFGLWSAFAERQAVINARLAIDIALIGTDVPNGAQLDFSLEVLS